MKIQISKSSPKSPIEISSMEFNNSHLTELDFLGKKVSKNVLIYYLKLLTNICHSAYSPNGILYTEKYLLLHFFLKKKKSGSHKFSYDISKDIGHFKRYNKTTS